MDPRDEDEQNTEQHMRIMALKGKIDDSCRNLHREISEEYHRLMREAGWAEEFDSPDNGFLIRVENVSSRASNSNDESELNNLEKELEQINQKWQSYKETAPSQEEKKTEDRDSKKHESRSRETQAINDLFDAVSSRMRHLSELQSVLNHGERLDLSGGRGFTVKLDEPSSSLITMIEQQREQLQSIKAELTNVDRAISSNSWEEEFEKSVAMRFAIQRKLKAFDKQAEIENIDQRVKDQVGNISVEKRQLVIKALAQYQITRKPKIEAIDALVRKLESNEPISKNALVKELETLRDTMPKARINTMIGRVSGRTIINKIIGIANDTIITDTKHIKSMKLQELKQQIQLRETELKKLNARFVENHKSISVSSPVELQISSSLESLKGRIGGVGGEEKATDQQIQNDLIKFDKSFSIDQMKKEVSDEQDDISMQKRKEVIIALRKEKNKLLKSARVPEDDIDVLDEERNDYQTVVVSLARKMNHLIDTLEKEDKEISKNELIAKLEELQKEVKKLGKDPSLFGWMMNGNKAIDEMIKIAKKDELVKKSDPFELEESVERIDSIEVKDFSEIIITDVDKIKMMNLKELEEQCDIRIALLEEMGGDSGLIKNMNDFKKEIKKKIEEVKEYSYLSDENKNKILQNFANKLIELDKQKGEVPREKREDVIKALGEEIKRLKKDYQLEKHTAGWKSYFLSKNNKVSPATLVILEERISKIENLIMKLKRTVTVKNTSKETLDVYVPILEKDLLTDLRKLQAEMVSTTGRSESRVTGKKEIGKIISKVDSTKPAKNSLFFKARTADVSDTGEEKNRPYPLTPRT